MSGARLFDPATSHAAAAIPRAGLRARVLAAHVHHDDRGLTDDELVQLFPDEVEGSVKKRRTELAHEGLIDATERTRPTRSGCAAIVWKATWSGYQQARGIVYDGRRPGEPEHRYRARREHECPDLGCGRSYDTSTGLLRHLIGVHGMETLRTIEKRSVGETDGVER